MARHDRHSALLMEILMAVLFFALSATVLLEGFAAAHEQSTRAGLSALALNDAQSLCDRLYATPDAQALLQGDGFAQEPDGWTLPCDGYRLVVQLTNEQTAAGTLRIAQVSAVLYNKEETLFTLPCARYLPGEVLP